MHNKLDRRSGRACAAAVGVLIIVTAWILFAATAKPVLRIATDRRAPAGFPQLISVDPLPAADGEMCQWVPASVSQSPDRKGGVAASETGRLVVPQDRALALAALMSPASAEDRTRDPVNADRAPVRILHDTYPGYSAVAVDSNTNEVFLQDENLFGIKVFNRMDNTPPSASFTEPKRILAGFKTKLEFNCGLYVDPQNGDIYSVANDTVDALVIFPHDAQGNLAPKRELHTPHGTYGIAVDEANQEMYLTVEHTNQVIMYRKMAEGEEKPSRILRGDKTKLADPHGLAIDTNKQLMFVTNHGHAHTNGKPSVGQFQPPSITVYPLKASGDTAPLRVITGPKTQLNWPANLALDPQRGELFVANDVNDSIAVFRETDDGDAAPIRVIHGPKTGLKNPTGIYLDFKNQELWASNMGNHSATVFAMTADGDVAPRRTIRSAPAGKLALNIGNPGAAGFDSKREQILVPN